MIATSTVLGLAIVGDDLHAALVRVGPSGVDVREVPALRGFLSMPLDAARAAIAPLLRTKRTTLVASGAWCAIRPSQLTCAEWREARAELLASIDQIVPLSADNALAGLIELFPEGGGAGAPPIGGSLIVVRKSTIAPWLERIEDLTGAPVERVLSPQMAMLGLGLQRSERARVTERVGIDGLGEVELEHRLEFGRPVAIGESPSGTDAAGAVVVLTSADPRCGAELAIGGALAPIVAGGVFRPLFGPAARTRRPWLAPAAAVGVAIVLAALAGPLFSLRISRASERLDERMASLEAPAARAREAREQAERIERLLTAGVNGVASSWRSVLPSVLDAQRALGNEGFLYRLELTDATLTISGEAPSAAEVMERMESSQLLRSARHAAPVSKSSVSGLDVFEIRAERREGGGS